MIIDLDDLQNLTAQEIISADMIDALYEIESKVDRRIKIAEVEKIAKKLKVLTPFRELVKAQEHTLKEGRAALKEQKKEEKKQEVQNGFNNTGTLELKDDEVVSFNTGKWIVDNTGVYYMYGAYQVKASHYPIIITQRFTDRETGKEELEAT
jgi:predicted phage gp36 major capsid-like protein